MPEEEVDDDDDVDNADADTAYTCGTCITTESGKIERSTSTTRSWCLKYRRCQLISVTIFTCWSVTVSERRQTFICLLDKICDIASNMLVIYSSFQHLPELLLLKFSSVSLVYSIGVLASEG